MSSFAQIDHSICKKEGVYPCTHLGCATSKCWVFASRASLDQHNRQAHPPPPPHERTKTCPTDNYNKKRVHLRAPTSPPDPGGVTHCPQIMQAMHSGTYQGYLGPQLDNWSSRDSTLSTPPTAGFQDNMALLPLKQDKAHVHVGDRRRIAIHMFGVMQLQTKWVVPSRSSTLLVDPMPRGHASTCADQQGTTRGP